MRKITSYVLMALVCLLAVTGSASAATKDTATATGDTIAYLRAPASYQSTTVCTVVCGHEWRAYGPNTGRYGNSMGLTANVSYTFPAIGFWRAVYTLKERCVGSPNNWCTSQATVYVQVYEFRTPPPVVN